jgi:hypothetical protein
MDPFGIKSLTATVETLAANLKVFASTSVEHDVEILAAASAAAVEGEHTCEASGKLLTLMERLVASQASLTALAEQVLTELQQTRNRTERTDGRAERLEFALEDLFTWLRERDQPPPDWAISQEGFQARPRRPLPAFPKTQAEIPDLEERRAQRDGRLALKGGG